VWRILCAAKINTAGMEQEVCEFMEQCKDLARLGSSVVDVDDGKLIIGETKASKAIRTELVF
jgi:hypothetical protein